MVNVGLSPGSILGIVVAVAGAALYFLRSMRPELARDHDIFFAAVALLCGGILFFQGWRLDPILFFGQLLLTGSGIYFAVDNIRLRQVATDQARRNTPIVDEDRPVSRVYRAEFDELEPVDEEDMPVRRQIRGSRDASSRRTAYVDELEGETRSSRRPNPSRSGERRDRSGRSSQERSRSGSPGESLRGESTAFDATAPETRSSRRRSSRPETTSGDDWQDDPFANSGSDGLQPTGGQRRGRSSRFSSDRTETSKSRRSRPRPESGFAAKPGVDASNSGDYVDYQPLDYNDFSDRESDNSSNFDDDR